MNLCNPIIELSDIRLRYGQEQIFSNVSLQVCRGDFMAVSGPNGAGKTTLLRILLKLLKPTSGRVTYFDAQGKPTKRLPIGYLPQKSGIDIHFPITVRQMVLSGLITGWGLRQPADAEQRLGEVSERLGLEPFLHKPINALSGGQLVQAPGVPAAAVLNPDAAQEAVQALLALGYSGTEAQRAVNSVRDKADTADMLILLALKVLGG